MKRIAIVGSGSFLARNFIKYSIDNNLDYSFDLYDYYERDEWPEFNFRKIDFSSVEDVKRIDFSVDEIFFFIGKTGTAVGFEKYQEFIEVNEIFLLNFLKAYVESGSRPRIIYPSSRLVFKSSETKTINEQSTRESKSVYAVTKQAAEEYLRIYKETFDVRYVIIRICTPIGSLLEEYGSYGTFEIFKKQAIEKQEITVFGTGLQRKTFTSILDICRAFSLVIDRDINDFGDYNIGGQELSLLEIAQSIAGDYAVPIKHIPWPDVYLKVDGGSVVFDSTRFDKEFGMKYEKVIE